MMIPFGHNYLPNDYGQAMKSGDGFIRFFEMEELLLQPSAYFILAAGVVVAFAMLALAGVISPLSENPRLCGLNAGAVSNTCRYDRKSPPMRAKLYPRS